MAPEIMVSGLVLVTLVSGFWLHGTGRPLNTFVFTVHKLSALAIVISTALLIHAMLKNGEISIVILTSIIIAGLSVLSLFVSGAILSIGKSPGNSILIVHNITTISAVISGTAAIYLLH